ncbi:MAG: hypothetical protein OXM59_02380 [Gammaproteobacteria bacterium]|nr:hypothetical protein [Gammaproteobacteria bacterium]
MTTVVAVQPRIRLAFPDYGRFDGGAIRANAGDSARRIEAACAEHGAGMVAFPEFFLTGYTLGVDLRGWLRASICIPGPETDVLSGAAQQNSVYVAGAAFETLDSFPGRYFNTAFLIAPNGDIVLKYRKHYAMTGKTRPGDVLDKWLRHLDEDSLFPVVTTPLGRIGAMVARDSHWPEMARCLALRGAEIIFNPNASGVEPDDAGIHARRSRAYENHCFLISPNIGPFVTDNEFDKNSGRAPSEIIDFRGNMLARRRELAEFMIAADLDIEALRTFRIAGGGKGNFLAQLQPHLHTPVYGAAELFPANGWREKPIRSVSENLEFEASVIQRMLRDDVLTPPESSG